jgi:uncharacterized RDD family membrane protein YckC
VKRTNMAAPILFAPADKFKRTLAFIIDSIISTVISTIIAGLVSQGPVSILIHMIVTSLYWIGCPYYAEGTPGKRIMGLRIVGEDQRTELTLKQLVMRESFGRVLSTLCLLIGYLWCFFNPEGKTWHDLMAKTQVVDYR